MNYRKSLFYNFLTVYFVDHLLPGIELMKETRFPHLGTDLPFAIGVGLLNSLIYPVLKLIGRSSALHIAIACLVLNFGIYALLKVLPLGIHVLTIKGYLLASFVVAAVSFATNYYSMRANRHHSYHYPKENPVPKPSFPTDEIKKPPL